MEDSKLLVLNNISKSFPGVKALDDINIELGKGEVLALVGENGAGKSTLIKIISGAYQQDEGSILFEGKDVGKMTPQQSLGLGISVIYQELSYLPNMTIAENILIGQQPKTSTGLIDYKTMNARSLELQKIVGLEKHAPTELVRNISTAEKQLLEIARAYSRNLKVLVLDEPTSALNDEEIEKLFSIIKSLREEGKSVIYISHRLDEIFEVGDRVQIMRDGKTVHISPIKDISREDIVRYMVGREIKDMYPISDREIGDTILELDSVTNDKVKDISLYVRKGEIVGIYGLMGAGCSEVLETVFGKLPVASGVVKMEGKEVSIKTPEQAIKHGQAYVPSERKTEGVITPLSVKWNITTVTLHKYIKNGLIDLKKENSVAKEWVDTINIKTPTIETPTNSLSGGNQQKVILAKWMDNDPKIFLLNEPTKGIDVGSKVEIYQQMEVLCNKGCGILLFTAELPELMAICDRTYVMFEGKIVAEIQKQDMTQELIVQKAIGE
ncbi:MAG: sugar ABC transporter ATP-binding protein [Oscillospiraceae bacterium]|nr:sugar ABC transporter ATP-binding protein [Oscillospiraceae bacterium]